MSELCCISVLILLLFVQGSFRCEKKRCNIGEKLDETGLCVRLSCGLGFEPGPSGNCLDLDECASDSACAAGEQCVNTMGSYECLSTCELGLRYILYIQYIHLKIKITVI